MRPPLRILIVEPDENRRWLLAHYVKAALRDAECLLVVDGEQAMSRIASEPIDGLVTNHAMNGINGVELIEWLRRSKPDLLAILISWSANVDLAALGVRSTAVLSPVRFSETGEVLAGLLRPGVNADKKPAA